MLLVVDSIDLIIIISPAQEFDPDRFIDERLQKYLVPNPFIFLPFNGGPRICLGQQVRSLRNSPCRPCPRSLTDLGCSSRTTRCRSS